MAAKTVYQDERYLSQASKLDTQKAGELNEVDVQYGDMIATNNKNTQTQIDAVRDYKDKQTQLQQEQSDLAIKKIEQQQEWAHQDYIKEQSGAYVDWQKQSNPYGVEAEKRASAGLAGTCYSESSLVSMYNTYQNRMATAREAFQRANTNFAMAIAEAQKQNSVALAEIAFKALQEELSLAAQGAQYENTLLLQKAADKRAINESYYTRYQDVIDQIYREDALAEEKRQADLANERALKEIAIAQAAQKLAEDKFKYEKEQDAAAKAEAVAAKAKAAATTKKVASATAAAGKVVANTIKSESAKTTTKSNYSTYSEAAAGLKKSGAIKSGDGGLMTKQEWTRRKASGSNRAETSYDTYEDYLNSFAAWRKANPEK